MRQQQHTQWFRRSIGVSRPGRVDSRFSGRKLESPRRGPDHQRPTVNAMPSRPSNRFRLGSRTPSFHRSLRTRRPVMVLFAWWLMTKIPGPRFRRAWGLLAFMALAQEETGQSLWLVLGLYRPIRLQNDRQNSATGVADVANRLSRPALELQQIEIFAQAIQRRIVLQGAAYAVLNRLVDFCLGCAHGRTNRGNQRAELATTTPVKSYSRSSVRATPNRG